MNLEFPLFVDSLAEFEEGEIDRTVKVLQTDFNQLEFLPTDDLDRFRTKAVRLLIVPIPPTYKAPPPVEQRSRIGPVRIFTSDRQKILVGLTGLLSLKIDWPDNRINHSPILSAPDICRYLTGWR